MYCRLELVDESKNRIKIYLKKQLRIYQNVLKLRPLYNHAQYLFDIEKTILKY